MTLNIVIFGLSITSSWGNGHATTYRALIEALAERGHRVLFLERDVQWYRDHRDLHSPSYCRTGLYGSLAELPKRFGEDVLAADLVILGSYVQDGSAIGDWITSSANGVTAFYDIDTPVTLAGLADGSVRYIAPSLIPRFDLYLSFTSGPVLDVIENRYGSPRARALHCAVAPTVHAPTDTPVRFDLGYLGTYSEDRQSALARLLIEPALRAPELSFIVAGPQYPEDIKWPANVQHTDHIPPAAHAQFYCGQRYSLNITRSDMVAAGYSPSVRLFEAAACGVPIISDRWTGIETFFEPGREILIADDAKQVVQILRETPDAQRIAQAAAARKRVLAEHTADHRAAELEGFYMEALSARLRKAPPLRTRKTQGQRRTNGGGTPRNPS